MPLSAWIKCGRKDDMSTQTLSPEKMERPTVSVATYAAIVATLLIMVLSAVIFAASPGEASSTPAYDPAVSVVGFANE
jgi:hypothetical protein